MMTNCIFCKIINQEIPCFQVYEDKDFLAFLDIRPLNPGHTLVIPKKHYQWVWQVSNLEAYWQATAKTALKLKKKLKAESMAVIVWGYEVPHAHIHLIPRFKGDNLSSLVNWSLAKKLTAQELKEIQEKICR